MDNAARQNSVITPSGERGNILETAPLDVKEQKISNWISVRIIGLTVLWIALTLFLLRHVHHWLVAAACFLAMAALQHRCNIIQHEAIHRLLFSNRFLNDLIGHYFFGASILTPATYRLYHFKHHRELGRESDPDFPGYTRFPDTRWGVIRFILENLIGLGVLSRFVAETRSAISRKPDVRAYHERRGWTSALKAWSCVGLVQGLLLWLFVASRGTVQEFLVFWVLPEVTLTRTLMAIRLMGEHTTRGEGYPPETRYLVTLPSNWLERIFFAPLAFNYHAEHHLFPATPWHRLERLHKRLVQLPEYRKIVGIRRGYLHSIFHVCTRQ